jgi:hypothetical protein
MRRGLLAALLLTACADDNPLSTGPDASNPLAGTCWTETRDQGITVNGVRTTYALTSRWEFLPDAAWVFTRSIPEDQLVVETEGGYWPEQLNQRRWPYTVERYRGRSLNLGTGEWAEVEPRAPETVEFFLQADGRLVNGVAVYEVCR